jgi:excisionase family DNA binding protein
MTATARDGNAHMEKLLTIDEVADRLNTTPRHVRRLVFERRIPYRKVGRFVRFHRNDLAEYLAAQRVAVGDIPASTRPGAGG